MSDESKPSTPSTLDLSSLRFMPNWVSDLGSASPSNIVSKYAGRDDEPKRDRGDRDRGGPRRPGSGGPGGERRDFRGGAGGGAGFKGGPRRDDRAPRAEEPRPVALPTGLKITVEPEDKALEMLSQHIKTQGRAFSLFDAARLVLAGPERHRVKVECEAERLVGLFQVPSDGSLFETREEAVRHLLKNATALAELYREEQIELEEPKGVFTSVAVCGMSGEVLGPPSHHSFQTALKRLHNERYSSIPFEDYRRRVRTETGEEFINKWKDQQRKGTRWVYLKGDVAEGAEPLSFSTRAEFEAHFRTHHADSSVIETREAIVHATVTREQLSPGLGRLLRRHIDEAKKHLFELSQKIAHGLERRGLKLFKRRSGKMFVSRVKPRAIDPGVVFSERVGAIVNAIKAEAGIDITKLVETVAPTVAAEAPAEGQSPPGPTEEQMAVMRDLHWLAEEGYVILYSDNVVFLGVQGEPPQHAPAAKAEAAPATEAATAIVAEAPLVEDVAPAIEGDATEVVVAEAAELAVEEAAPAAEVVIAEPEVPFVEEVTEPAVEAEAPTAELVEPEPAAKSDA